MSDEAKKDEQDEVEAHVAKNINDEPMDDEEVEAHAFKSSPSKSSPSKS